MARFINSGGIKGVTLTISNAGTAQQFDSLPVPDGVTVMFMAHPDNTGYIKIGETAAKAQQSYGTDNVPLVANQIVGYQISNVSIPFFDTTVSGEKVIAFLEF